MPGYEIQLFRVARFQGKSNSGKPRRRIVRSSLTIQVTGVQDEASWYQELDRISQEFDLGRTWKLLATKRI